MVIVALVGLSLAIDATDDTARGLVIAALGASLVGDVVLMAPDGNFTGGLGAFLIAHLLYIAALADSVSPGPALAGAIIVVALLLGVVPQLLGAVIRLSRSLAAAVAVYIVAVSVTAIFSVGTGVVVAGVGGCLLLASDALLGWDRFVGPAPGGTHPRPHDLPRRTDRPRPVARGLTALAALVMVAACGRSPVLDRDALESEIPSALAPAFPDAITDVECPELIVEGPRTVVCTAAIRDVVIEVSVAISADDRATSSRPTRSSARWPRWRRRQRPGCPRIWGSRRPSAVLDPRSSSASPKPRSAARRSTTRTGSTP